MAYNSYLDQFLMFYSQSDFGNGLTRGLETELAQRTYVETRLDKVLTKAILDNHFHLVILTGNAGDGKTSFIQKVEEAAKHRGATVTRKGTLGASFQLGGREYETLYDGSVDADMNLSRGDILDTDSTLLSDQDSDEYCESCGRPMVLKRGRFGQFYACTGSPDCNVTKPVGRWDNRQLLQDFFRPFEGEQPPSGEFCKIVALNEGKLREFFTQSTKHRWLSTVLLDHPQADKALPEGLALINLNLRSVVDAAEEPTDCLFDRILDRYVAPEFWQVCETCAARYRCPVKLMLIHSALCRLET